MENQIKIVSDGVIRNTQILFNEVPMDHVEKIVIHPIANSNNSPLITATVTFHNVALDITPKNVTIEREDND